MSVLTNARIEWSGTNYTTQAQSVNLSYSAEEVDDTVFGDGTRSAEGGLKNWSADVSFIANESTSGGNTNDIFSDIGTTATLAIRPTTSAIAASNPEYSGTALCVSMEPVAGSVGDQQNNSVSWVAAGDLARNTS